MSTPHQQQERLTETVAVKVTPAERKRIEEAAGKERLSSFGRRILLAALDAKPEGGEA